ncbi:MAG: HlyD family efflux transporter periplasmic adaptor subunit, partial [Sedimentisphaerales bacterium]|nr:HlyD family efflux transporter periplasmic adaptor subunit [Sedimentisphaerales bacterium]
QLDPNLVALEIENIRMQIALDTAEQEAQIRLAYARDNYGIIKDLFESQVGSIRVGTVKEMREAEQQRDLMALSVITARREHTKLLLQLRQMEKRRTQYAIRAPWDGVMVPFSSVKNVPQLENLKMPEPGEMVQIGQALVALMKVDRLRVPWTVPASQLDRLRLGKAVRVYIPNDSTDSIPGAVVFISPTVESTGLVLIEVELANPATDPPAGGDWPRGFYRYRYRPGMSARVEIP